MIQVLLYISEKSFTKCNGKICLQGTNMKEKINITEPLLFESSLLINNSITQSS